MAACRELTSTAYEGLDVEREIRAVQSQSLGEVVLLDDASGLAGMAVCHLGADTEAGSGGCYVKFGLTRPGPGAPARFEALLDACEALAADRGAHHVELGVNAGRHEAYAAVQARGYRTGFVGVSMHRSTTMATVAPAPGSSTTGADRAGSGGPVTGSRRRALPATS